MDYQRRTTCRVCGNSQLRTILELGPMPLVNAMLDSPRQFESEAKYPLDVVLCTECSLVQTPDVVAPEVLFRDYVYRSGYSDLMRAHFRDQAAAVTDELRLTRDDLVVEIASNDGTLLRGFRERGVRTLGVEPARAAADEARVAGVETLDLFFTAAAAESIRRERGPARAVLASNVLAHVDAPIDFLRGCRTLLGDAGRVIIEVPYVRDLLERLEYDTIYHEHLCYFSAAALVRACAGAGLDVLRIERVPVHGGSLRLHATPARGADRDKAGNNAGSDVQSILREEQSIGLGRADTWSAFAARVARHRDELRAFLAKRKQGGRRIAAYGAPAKGNTLLNWCRIGPELVDFTVDRNPAKIGRFTPGMHLPVLPVEALLERQPDDVLILAWNLAEEIVAQQAEVRRRGGCFLVPIPVPRVVGSQP